jgi:class 3 adenylate cyclase
VRAGLELVAAVGGLKTHAPLQTRVGIATGLVVVGDLIGSGASREQAIVGETPNLAARLQGIAELEKTAHELTSAFGNHDVVRLFRWLRSQVHGRRSADLLWLSAGT